MSFSAGLSGLNAHQLKLRTIGNNLANINTIGYKSSQVAFADMVSQSVGGASTNPMQIGLGVNVAGIAANFSQGGLDYTGVATHVAIQGNGFFVVGDNTARGYTRAGNFALDSNGVLVTADGRPVQGFTEINPVTGEVNTNRQPGNIVVPVGQLLPPVTTTLFGSITNLNAATVVGGAFTTSVPIYDSLGTVHVANVAFTKVGNGAWTYAITVPGEEIVGGVAGVPSVLAAGALTFDGTGRLATVNGAAPADVAIVGPAWANGAAPAAITWDVMGANGQSTLSSYTAPSATSAIAQNGSPAGAVSGLSIDATGRLLVSVGAGQSVVMGQLAIAGFANPQGLNKQGSSMFSESQVSGAANIGTAGTGGRGSLVGSSLEQSNVDIAQEFTQMILAQRGYQANSRSITTTDELLVETLNLKR